DQKLDAADVEGIARAKAELLADDGVLHLVPTSADLDAIGGLDELKRWLRLRARGFEPAAKDFGLEPPRGVLIAGVPGCGKSLTAKCVARSWSMPLVLLDPARSTRCTSASPSSDSGARFRPWMRWRPSCCGSTR